MKKREQKNFEGNYSRRIRPLTILMLFVIFFTSVTGGLWYYDAFGRDVELGGGKNGTEEEEKNSASESGRREQEEKEEQIKESGIYAGFDVDSDIADMVITDEEDAMEALLAIQGDMGNFGTEDEYRLLSVEEAEDSDVYAYQQYYNGIEVYGHALKLKTDKSGKVELLNSGYAAIENCDTEIQASESDAYESAEKYLKETYQLSADDVMIENYGEIIYFSESGEALAGYLFHIYEEDIEFLQILVDGKSADIVSAYEPIQYDMVQKKLNGQKVKQTLDVYQDSEKHILLEDVERNLYCFRAERKKKSFFGGYEETVIDDYYEEGAEGAVYDGSLFSESESAVDALANLERAYDYYFDTYGRKGIDNNNGRLRVIDNVTAYNNERALMTNNAAWMDATGGESGLIAVFPKEGISYTFSQWLDIMGHEYTHGVVNRKSKLGVIANLERDAFQKSVQMAINEGLADVFGELIEDWSDGQPAEGKTDGEVYNNSCNWIFAETSFGRNIKKCESDETLLTDVADHKEGETDCHDASTLVSYPAYLMAQEIDTKTLGKIWYNAIDSLYNTSGFLDLRFAVEMQALKMNVAGELSDKQMECVIDALDRVGMPMYTLYQVTPDSALTVFDYEDQVYQNYHIGISKEGQIIAEQDVKESSYVLKDIVPGIYRVTLTDLENPDLKKTFLITVNDNDSKAKVDEYNEEWSVYTDFRSRQREVALVLDVSGSMDGTPIEEIRKSAVKFVDVVLNENANTKISIITYNTGSSIAAEASSNRQELYRTINGLSSGGGTNMYDALGDAQQVLKDSRSSNRIVVLMSDGAPNEGTTDENGSYETPVTELADRLKQEDYLLYTFGFYHNLDGGELVSCKALMDAVASEGYAYVVSDAAEVVLYFNDVASQVSGERYIYIKIACPVDVIVKKDGEVLSSLSSSENTRTKWGTLSYQGEENEEKVLRLLEDEGDYEICIAGTGRGEMDYTIGFADEEGGYSDMRTFENVPITPETTIATNTSASEKTFLKVDTDGDGKFDLQYAADRNERGKEITNKYVLYLLWAAVILAVFLFVVKILIAIRRFRANRICRQCKSRISKGMEFCSECGAAVVRKRLFLPQKIVRKKQHKAVWITKLVVIGICFLFCGGWYLLKNSAADTVFNQIRSQAYDTGEYLYDAAVSDSRLGKIYLSAELEHYLTKAEHAYRNGDCKKEEVRELYVFVSGLQLGAVSDKADDYLLDLEKNIETMEE